MELFMHILHFRSTQYLNSSCSSSNTVDSGAKITGAYGGTPLQIVPHILSYFKISSTVLFGLQCEARARTKNITQNSPEHASLFQSKNAFFWGRPSLSPESSSGGMGSQFTQMKPSVSAPSSQNSGHIYDCVRIWMRHRGERVSRTACDGRNSTDIAAARREK